MPRACPVEIHAGRYIDSANQQNWMPPALGRGGSRSQLNSRDRETPRGKPVASGELTLDSDSRQRETPRDKPVASLGGLLTRVPDHCKVGPVVWMLMIS